MFQCCLNGDGWQINTYCSGRGSKITESKWLSELELVNTPRPLQRYLTLEWLVIVLVWRQKPDVTGCLFSVRTVYPSVSCLLLSRVQSTSEPQQFTAQLKSAYLHVFWPVNHQLVACFFILVITVIFLLQAEARASRDYLPSSHVMHHLRLLIIRTVSRSAQFVSSQHLVSLWALLLYVVYCFFCITLHSPWCVYVANIFADWVTLTAGQSWSICHANCWQMNSSGALLPKHAAFFFCGGSDSWGSGSFVTWEKVAL